MWKVFVIPYILTREIVQIIMVYQYISLPAPAGPQVLLFYIEDESQPLDDRKAIFEYFGNFTRREEILKPPGMFDTSCKLL